MLMAFKIILLIIISTSFIMALGSKNKDEATRATALCIASIISFAVSMKWL